VKPGAFIGVSELGTSEQGARNAALLDARRQIVSFLGVKLTSKHVEEVLYHRTDRDRTEGGKSTEKYDLAIETKMKALANNVVRVREDRVFTQCFLDSSDRMSWKAYVRAPFDHHAHQKFILDWVAETAGLVEKWLVRPAPASPAHHWSVLGTYSGLLSLCGELRELVGLPAGLGAQVEDLHARLSEKARGLLGQVGLAADNPMQTRASTTSPLKPLAVRAWLSPGELPLGRVPVTFSSELPIDGLPAELSTDTSGQALLHLDPSQLGEADHVVVARLGSPTLWGSFPDGAFPAAEFQIVRGRARLLVRVGMNLPDQAEVTGNPLEKGLVQALTDAGFQVSSPSTQVQPPQSPTELLHATGSADLRAVVWVDVSFTSREAGAFGPDAFCYAMSIEIRVLDHQTGATLLSLALPDETYRDLRGYGFGAQGPQQAVLDALSGRTRKEYPRLLQDLAGRIAASVK